jgi:glycosyltransferase involved in cell wall biosynthesis
LALSFLIVDTYYPAFLESFHARRPELVGADYEETLGALMTTCFGTSDFYSKNLRLLGHEALDVIANDRVLQAKWAASHDMALASPPASQKLMRRIPYLRRYAEERDWILPLLARRIKEERPDVLYVQDIGLCEPWFIREVRPFAKLIVGQIASLPPAERYLRGCDLILTSFPRFVDRFRSLGIGSEYLKIGFESTVLDRLTELPHPYGAVFVGGFANVHTQGSAILEKVAAEIELDVWGYGAESLPAGSALKKRFHGEAWGLDMYNVFHNSKIVVNRHGLVAPENEAFANNMRLYEATGVGAMLLTDEKDNLDQLFELGTEVVSYSDVHDLVEKIRYYLAHEEERSAIAHAGQERTLKDHTYLQRMKELEQIIEAYS